MDKAVMLAVKYLEIEVWTGKGEIGLCRRLLDIDHV